MDIVGAIRMLLARAHPLRDRPTFLFADTLEMCEEILDGVIRRSNDDVTYLRNVIATLCVCNKHGFGGEPVQDNHNRCKNL